MRRIISFFMALTVATGIYACTGSSYTAPNGSTSTARNRTISTAPTGTISTALNGSPSVAPAKKVDVFYFHFTRRCMTCNNVEKVSKEAVETQFAAQVKSGEIAFKSVNLDEKEGEAIGAKYKIEGQTLIVISGDKRVDLTDKGFMYANDSPAKLKAEIKKAVDGMLH